jgi:hypothetical protein
MAGTVGPATKAEIIRRLKEAPEHQGNKHLTIAYSFPGNEATRELIYGGQITGPVALSTMAVRGGLVGRREDPVVQLHYSVNLPGEPDTQKAEARIAELARVTEELLAGDPTLNGAVPGLLLAAITNYIIDSGNDDDGAIAEMTHTISLISHIR